jgi:hypothetical protein
VLILEVINDFKSREHVGKASSLVQQDQMRFSSGESPPSSRQGDRQSTLPTSMGLDEEFMRSASRVSAGSRLFGTEERIDTNLSSSDDKVHSVTSAGGHNMPIRLSRLSSRNRDRDEESVRYLRQDSNLQQQSLVAENPNTSYEANLTRGEILFNQTPRSGNSETSRSKAVENDSRQPQNRASATNPSDRAKQGSQKQQPRRGHNGNGSDDDDRDTKRPKVLTTDAEDVVERRVICPFYRRTPLAPVVSTSCMGPGFDKFQNLKSVATLLSPHFR